MLANASKHHIPPFCGAYSFFTTSALSVILLAAILQKGGQIMKNLRLLTGNANLPLAQDVSTQLGVDLVEAEISRFSDGETSVHIAENIRGTDVFILQPTCPPVNDHLMELVVMVDACRRASANTVSAIIPYFGYARQDRKTSPRDPITAKLVANMIVASGADRLVAMDLHAKQIQGFFDIPVDDMRAEPVLAEYIRQLPEQEKVTIVSPDVGGVTRARSLARKLDLPLALIDKRRPKANVSEVMNVIGTVEGRHCVIVDDIIDTAGTLCSAAGALIEKCGAKSVQACISHGLFSGPAVERIANSALTRVVVTDSIPLSEAAQKEEKIQVASVAPLLAEAIRRINNSESLAELYDAPPERVLELVKIA